MEVPVDWSREIKRLQRKLAKPRYSEYELMTEYPYVYSALLLYTEEILQVNPDTGRIYEVEADPRTMDVIETL